MDGLTLTRGTGEEFSSTLRAAGRMLTIAKARESLGRKRNPFPPLAHLLVNIFLCAFAERYLADDPGGIYLPLFLVVQWSLGLLITMSFVGGAGADIVRKTRLFPGSAAAGYCFLLAGNLRRPEFYLFTAAGCVFPAAVYAHGFLHSAGIIALSVIPVLTLQMLCCAAAVRMVRAARPVAGLVLFTFIAPVAVVTLVFVFRTAALASVIPMAGWAASGIRAFAVGHPGEGWKYLLYLTLIWGAVVAIFRK
ncbi:MAG TPA: hypothetical protein VJO14_08310 [Bacteroidota bacterium]|nr:hypothetical protein [Bacteroidota bacterium]